MCWTNNKQAGKSLQTIGLAAVIFRMARHSGKAIQGLSQERRLALIFLQSYFIRNCSDNGVLLFALFADIKPK